MASIFDFFFSGGDDRADTARNGEANFPRQSIWWRSQTAEAKRKSGSGTGRDRRRSNASSRQRARTMTNGRSGGRGWPASKREERRQVEAERNKSKSWWD